MLEEDFAKDPLEQFERWFEDARRALELPEAMTLATAAADGTPSARMVLLKGVDERGFLFFTNYESRKGRELADNPRAALVFHWALDPRRQVLVTGRVERLAAEESDEYFRTRPHGSRLAAMASRQSTAAEPRGPRPGRGRGSSASTRVTTCRGPPGGAGTCCARTPSSSGRTAPTGSTTACATGGTTSAGSWSVLLPSG